MKAITLHQGEGKPGKVYHPITLSDLPIPVPGPGQVLVKLKAAAYNHRDLFIREGLYPGAIYSTPSRPSILGGDGAGIVVAPFSHSLHNKPVLISSAVNWISSPLGPEDSSVYGNFGGVKATGGRGTFAEYLVVDGNDVVACPEHFLGRGKEGWSEAASVPLGGVTAWRATFTKGEVKANDNVLVTGIGGGVALMALQYCLAAGANVWVSSSSEEKIKRAVALGAKGGVNYKDRNWSKTLLAALPPSRPYLDTVIDGGGGSIMLDSVRLLKHGGIVSCYGMTALGTVAVPMTAVLKNIEFRGSTMGSLIEFKDAIAFIAKHKIRPPVDIILDGLAQAEIGFQIMKKGSQFGKITISIGEDGTSKL